MTMAEVAVVSLQAAFDLLHMEIPMVTFIILLAGLCTLGRRISFLCIQVTVVSIHPGTMRAVVRLVTKAAEMPKT